MGGTHTLAGPPEGSGTTTVDLLDAAGNPVASVMGVSVPFGNRDGGQILFRQPDDAIFQLTAFVRIAAFDVLLRVR
jgi:hypothetical protein